jgi:2-amino-4-hydroxy-6-hydroxymethyldihydropteridine diphosphokinase
MKLIALGSNLGARAENLRTAARELAVRGFEIIAWAPIYVTTPVPKSEQPDFLNSVIQVQFAGTAEQALQICLDVETQMGRTRNEKNEARVLDLDVIAWDDTVQSGPPELPHPRMHERAFVIYPLCDIASEWPHPILQKTAAELKAVLPDNGIHLSEEQW